MTALGTCGDCVHWDSGAPAIASAIKDPAVAPDLGTCCVMPPQISRAGPFWATALFPQTHASRFCGEWEAIPDDPGGGEEQPVPKPDNVLPFDRSVA